MVFAARYFSREAGSRCRIAISGAFSLMSCVAIATPAVAADGDIQHVTFHRHAGAFSGNLPTKKTFVLDIKEAESFEEVEVVYWRSRDSRGTSCSVEQAERHALTPPPKDAGVFAERRGIDTTSKMFFVPIQPLARDASYCFEMTFFREPNALEKDRVSKFFEGLIDRITEINEKAVEAETKKQFKDFDQYKVASGMPFVDAMVGWMTSKDVMAMLRNLAQAKADFKNALDTARHLCSKLLPDGVDKPISDGVDKPIPEGVDKPTKKRDLGAEAAAKADKVLAAMIPVRDATNKLPSCVKGIQSVDANNPKELDTKLFLDELPDYKSAIDTFVKAHCEGDGAKNAELLFIDKQMVETCKTLVDRRTVAGQYGEKVSQAEKAGKTYATTKLDAVTKMLETVGKILVTDPLNGGATVHPGHAEKAGLYISADVGFMATFLPSTNISPFVGANFYLVPVDKDDTLKFERGNIDFWRRFALTGGLAFNVKDGAGTIQPALSVGAPFVGAGLRLSDYLRIVGGGVFVLQKDANPLISNERLRVLPYVGASVDLDVAGTIKTMVTAGQSAL